MDYTSVMLAVALALGSGQPPGAAAERRQQILDYQLTMPRANQLITAREYLVGFAKTHLTELKPKMDAADGARGRQ